MDNTIDCRDRARLRGAFASVGMLPSARVLVTTLVSSYNKRVSANARKEHLRLAADDRIKAAAELFDGGRDQLAAYVNHVGIECLLKARILGQAGVDSVAALRELWAAHEVDALFSGSSGHSLQRLAEKASLRRVLQADDALHLLQNPAWKSLCNVMRPYSLRYGQESPSRKAAKGELEWGASLRDRLWNSL